MRVFIFLPLFFLFSCGQDAETTTVPNTDPCSSVQQPPVEYLVSAYNLEEELYFTNQCGYPVIAEGKYIATTSDTIRHLGFVFDTSGRWLGINFADSVLFEVYNFDNGPDYVEEGLFRIVKDSLIGYADEQGNVVIEPQFRCAWPFEGDAAQVSMDCKISTEFEMTKWESENWFYIDKTGTVIKTE